MNQADTLALVQQMITGQRSESADPAALLAEHEDPAVRLVAQMWARQSSAQVEAPSSSETVRERPSEVETTDRAAELVGHLRRKCRALEEELRLALEIGDALAAALGSCYVCWGLDDQCPNCGGRGASGWSEPDPKLFAEYVLPAVKRVRQSVERVRPAVNKSQNHDSRSDAHGNEMKGAENDRL